MTMDITTVTVTCPQCTRQFQCHVPTRLAHWYADGVGPDCDTCRYEGSYGFFYAPIGLLARLSGALLGHLESTLHKLSGIR